MEKSKIKNIIEDIIILLFIIILCYGIYYNIKIKKELDYYRHLDYTDSIKVNIKYRDSIIYNIQYRDSIIYNINEKLKDENEKIYSLDDSSTIDLFYKLATGD